MQDFYKRVRKKIYTKLADHRKVTTEQPSVKKVEIVCSRMKLAMEK